MTCSRNNRKETRTLRSSDGRRYITSFTQVHVTPKVNDHLRLTVYSRYIPNNLLARSCRTRQGNLVGVLTYPRSFPTPSLAAMAQKGTFRLFLRREQNTNLIKLVLLCIERPQREPLAQNSVSPAPFQLAPSWTVQTTAAPKLFTSLNPFVPVPIWTDCLLLVLAKWLLHQWRKESLSWGRKVSDVDQDLGLRSSDLDTTCV